MISDTHGKLDTINEKILQTKADFVIHAGDFGFYDEQSLIRLSPRELRLLVKEQHKLGRLSEETILAYDIIKRDIPKKEDGFKKNVKYKTLSKPLIFGYPRNR